MEILVRFARDQSGGTAIEYGLIGSLISVVIIRAVTIGTTLAAIFSTIFTQLAAAV